MKVVGRGDTENPIHIDRPGETHGEESESVFGWTSPGLMCRDPLVDTVSGANSVSRVRLLLVAPPGAGKGTQATRLAVHYGIAHLSSGALLRAEVTNGTRIGKVAADYLRRGDLVPDELVFEMLASPVLEATRNGGYVLDGFPRTLGQAEVAYSVAQEIKDIELQAVIYLRVGYEELLARLRARADQEGRTDDDEITIAHRFNVFETQTEPLLGFYNRRGILLDINGDQPVEDVFRAITRAIDSLRN